MNTFDYTCTNCGRVKKYKRKRDYENAVAKQKPCAKCMEDNYEERMEQKFFEWVNKRQQEHKGNPEACKYMDNLNANGFAFKHALNGGEEFLDITYTDSLGNCHRGIFLDGWDCENLIVFEWDEPHHNTPENIITDFDRQTAIFAYFQERGINVGFVRYDEENGELYRVEPQNPYNVVMRNALQVFLNHLKRWYSNSLDVNRDRNTLVQMSNGIKLLKQSTCPPRTLIHNEN